MIKTLSKTHPSCRRYIYQYYQKVYCKFKIKKLQVAIFLNISTQMRKMSSYNLDYDS